MRPRPDSFRLSLARLGLGRHEASIYATLVERSPIGASELARIAGLARSSVYTALASLSARGLVGTTHEAGVKRFVAEEHAALVDAMKRDEQLAKERAELATGLESHFEKRASQESSSLPHVVHFEGIEGLKRVYLTMLREAPRGACMRILRDDFLWTEEWSFVSSREWRTRVRALRAEQRVSTRLLVSATSVERERAKDYHGREHLEYRWLPDAMRIGRFAIYAVGDVAAIMSTEERNLVGIQIANRNLTANLGSLFDGLWGLSRSARSPRSSRSSRSALKR